MDKSTDNEVLGEAKQVRRRSRISHQEADERDAQFIEKYRRPDEQSESQDQGDGK